MTALQSAPQNKTEALLAVEGLTVDFKAGGGVLRAVDGFSVSIGSRETVGLVGESGSGKTTIGRAIVGLTPVTSGSVRLDGRDITYANHRLRRQLSADIQVVFQDPYSSLNPSRTVGQTLLETLRVHRDCTRADLEEQARQILARVGLPGQAMTRYPTSFSGGQRQRIAIARALIVGPRLVICDEPVSALDLSVQAQVLNLLRELQTDLDLSYLFIAHDLAVVRHLSHRIVVLYRGRVMEEGSAEIVYRNAAHPYTQSLLEAAPVPDPDEQERRRLVRAGRQKSEASSWPTAGCPFAQRCPHATDVCHSERPRPDKTPEGSLVACHKWLEIRAHADSELRRTPMPRTDAAGHGPVARTRKTRGRA